MRRTLTTIGISLGLALWALGLPHAAKAAEPRRATVAVDIVRASKTPGRSDPRLEKFRMQLADFSFKKYKLLDSRLVTVEEKKTVSIPLEKGRKLRGKSLDVTFVKVEKDGKVRLRLLIPEVLDTTVSLSLDGVVILGGPAIPSGKNGVLFLPVTLVNVSS
ncbi:MAG TPA: hypothetical protein VKY51_03610 [Fredinandcohnia sp.]|nr:hypothetical protein [Fredinandcohnia sp.]